MRGQAAAQLKVICETGLSIFAPPHVAPQAPAECHNSLLPACLLAVRIYIPVVAPLAQLAADDIDFCYRKTRERGREKRR